MLIDKCRIRSIIHDYRQESPYTIQYLDLDVLTERIWKYIERRESRIIFEIEALNLNILVANPVWKRGYEVAISHVVALHKANTFKVGDTIKVRSAIEGAPDEIHKITRSKSGYLILDDAMGTRLSEFNLGAVQKINKKEGRENGNK